MPRKIYKPEDIIRHLQAADILLSQGKTVDYVSKKIGITVQTFYRWRKEYGGMTLSQAKRLKELEKQNSQLKKVVADLTLDKLILKEALEGNY